MKVLYIIIGIVAVLWLLSAKSSRDMQKLKNEGLYPVNREATMHDVQRLIDTGHKIQAIKLYREIHNVGLKEAKEEVEKIQAKGNNYGNSH